MKAENLKNLNFREAGFTDNAVNYPLGEQAQEIVAITNNTTIEAMPDTWRYAPNEYMRDWYEWLGREYHEGRTIYQSGSNLNSKLRIKPK